MNRERGERLLRTQRAFESFVSVQVGRWRRYGDRNPPVVRMSAFDLDGMVLNWRTGPERRIRERKAVRFFCTQHGAG